MNAASPPPSTPAGENGFARERGLSFAVRRFLALLPALLAALLCVRGWSLWAGLTPAAGSGAELARIALAVLGADLLVFARGLPLLFLLSWPCLLLRGRAGAWAVGAVWSAWLGVHVALEQFYLAARAPLGADLFGYTLEEMRTTAGGAQADAVTLAGWLLPPLVLWGILAWRARRAPVRSRTPAVAVLAIAGLAWLLPLSALQAGIVREDTRVLVQNRFGLFVADNLRYFRERGVQVPSAPAATASAAIAATPADPRYPFLREERTPDVLGPYFQPGGDRPPHLVVILVEGLGRSFSGPDAALGSFTPFLDELGGRSLYWSNFLANQGRTFATLPSVFGSLPFGAQGFAALGEDMPAHAGLLGVLKRQGYALQFYGGFDADFDNERLYLQREGVERIVDRARFGPGYAAPQTSWGYDDAALFARVAADLPRNGEAPTVTVIQTMSMHTPYRVPGQAAYRRRFELRLDELGIAEADKARYRRHADIYATVLFADDALRRYFDAAARAPGYDNTIFVITGDHRLPEIPMDTRIERYHVPLIVFSPRLKAPARFRAVSSHLDIAPSLLAYLAHRHGLQRPQRVTWTGPGLDTGRSFRSGHDIPLKQAKTLLADFVSGPWFISHDRLYRLRDNLRIESLDDPVTQAQVLRRFARYRRANDRFAAAPALSPEGAEPTLVAYRAAAVATATPAGPPDAVAMPRRALHVNDVQVPAVAEDGRAEVTALFSNDADAASAAFVPLLVLSDAQGRELRESYAGTLQLAPGDAREARFRLDLAGLASGRYFVAVIPSHPASGRRVGEGIYRVPMQVRCCGLGGGVRSRP